MIPYTHTSTFGHGPRRALAIHCTLGHAGAWRRVGEALADDLTITAMDMIDHGRSASWDRQGNLHDIVTQMARAQLTEPMDVIGHSFGATVALRLAVESPELVRTVTMIEPVFFAAPFTDDPSFSQAYDTAMKPFMAAFDSGDMAEAARIFNRDWGDGTKWDDLNQGGRDYLAQRIHFVPASGPMLRDDSAGLLAPGVMERASMPGVLIEGECSPPISGQICASLQKRMPQLDRCVIKGAGHMAPVTHPQPVAEAIRELLDK